MHGLARSYCRASRVFASWHEMVSSDTHTWSSRASSQTQLTASMMDLNFCILNPCMVFVTVAYNRLCADPHACREFGPTSNFLLPILQFCPSLQWRRKTRPLDRVVQVEPIIHRRLPELLQDVFPCESGACAQLGIRP